MINLFTYIVKWLIIAIFLLSINGCTYLYKKSIIQDAKPLITSYKKQDINNKGSLFQDKTLINYGYQSLFEDRRPYNIGDILTVILQENISASNSSSANLLHDANTHLGISFVPGLFNPLFGANVKNTTSRLDGMGINGLSGKGSNSANNKFSGLITVVIQDIFPNGNLKILGEKQVIINKVAEIIRFSGIVDPKNINSSNFITSTQVADAHIEYITSDTFNNIQDMGWLQKILLKISPV